MSERFERLYKLQKNLYIDGAPIIISDGALLKDTTTGSIIAQIKFHSLSENVIKAVKISISGYDVSGAEVEGVEDYQYLDLTIKNGEEFGSNKAIVLPNTVTRSFAIKCIVVVFSDNSQWNCENVNKFDTLPISKELVTELRDAELCKQYRLETTEKAQYIPQKSNNLWCCSCGKWNSVHTCVNCHQKKEKIFSTYNFSYLENAMLNRIEKERKKQEEAKRLADIAKNEEEKQLQRKQEEQKERQILRIKKLKKTITFSIPVVLLVLVFSLWLWPKFLQPSFKYSSANTLLSSEKYEDAIQVFETLKGYKNSDELLVKSKYQLAIKKLKEESDKEAFELFNAVHPYGDSETYLSKFKFNIATKNDGDYIETYNEQGLLVSRESTTSNFKIIKEYDKLNRIISSTTTGATLDNTTTKYEYDSKGNLILESEIGEFHSKDQKEERVEYVYSSDNKLLKETHKFIYEKDSYFGGKYDYEHIYLDFYEYNKKGELFRKYSLNFGDSAISESEYIEYKYDSDGNCIAETTYSSNSASFKSDVNELITLDETTKERIVSMSEKTLYSNHYTYNDGLLIEEKRYYDSNNPKQYSLTKYYYDDYGILTHKDYQVYGENSIKTTTYKYDNYGNLSTVTHSSGNVERYTYTPIYTE